MFVNQSARGVSACGHYALNRDVAVRYPRNEVAGSNKVRAVPFSQPFHSPQTVHGLSVCSFG